MFQPSSSLGASSVEVHTPKAAGVMIVRPGVPVKDSNIDYYYSTDYTPVIYPTHKERQGKNEYPLLSRIREFKLSTSITFHASMVFSC